MRVLFLYIQAFKPVVGKSLLKPVIAVEFLLDRQLDFLTDNSAYQPYQVIIKSLCDSTLFVFKSIIKTFLGSPVTAASVTLERL